MNTGIGIKTLKDRLRMCRVTSSKTMLRTYLYGGRGKTSLSSVHKTNETVKKQTFRSITNGRRRKKERIGNILVFIFNNNVL